MKVMDEHLSQLSTGKSFCLKYSQLCIQVVAKLGKNWVGGALDTGMTE